MTWSFQALSNLIWDWKQNEKETSKGSYLIVLENSLQVILLFLKQVSAVSSPFRLRLLTPLAIESQVSCVLLWAEGLPSFYVGGLKLITDCGLFLYMKWTFKPISLNAKRKNEENLTFFPLSKDFRNMEVFKFFLIHWIVWKTSHRLSFLSIKKNQIFSPEGRQPAQGLSYGSICPSGTSCLRVCACLGKQVCRKEWLSKLKELLEFWQSYSKRRFLFIPSFFP